MLASKSLKPQVHSQLHWNETIIIICLLCISCIHFCLYKKKQKTVFCEYWGHLKSLKAAAERRFLTIAVARQFLRSCIGLEVGLGCKRKCRSVPVSLAARCRKKIFLVSADSKNKQTNKHSARAGIRGTREHLS